MICMEGDPPATPTAETLLRTGCHPPTTPGPIQVPTTDMATRHAQVPTTNTATRHAQVPTTNTATTG